MKTILVTGASRGLGNQIVWAYLRMGNRVIGMARTSSKIDHENYSEWLGDITSEEFVGNTFREIKKLGTYPSVVINCAGISQSSLLIQTNVKQATEIMTINFLGPLIVSKQYLMNSGGIKSARVLNMISINQKLHSSGSAVYNSSKAALEELGKSLAIEFKKYDVTFNSIGLSLIQKTGMAEALSEEAVKDKVKSLAKPGLLSIDEVMNVIEMFASEFANKITGQTIYFGGP